MDAMEFNLLDTNLKRETAEALNDRDRAFLLNEQWVLIYRTYEKCIQYGQSSIQKDMIDQILCCDHILSKSIWHYTCLDYREDFPDRILNGGIFNCDLGSNLNNEQSRSRPVIVISDTRYSNFNTLSNIIVAPITSKVDDILDHEIKITETKYGDITGKIDLSQIRSLSKSRLSEKPNDRLLRPQEYEALFSKQEKRWPTMQEKIKSKLKLIFGIDI